MQRAKFKEVSGDRSPERQHLADAIAQRDAAQSDLVRAEEALDVARRRCWVASDALEQAAKSLEQSRSRAGSNVVELLLAGSTPPRDQTLREARRHHEEAEDDLAAARAAVSRLELVIPERQKTLLKARQAVQQAAHAVIRSEAPDLTADLRNAWERLRGLRSATHWLYQHCCCADSEERDFSWQIPVSLDHLNQSGDTVDLLRRVKADHNADAQHEAWQSWEHTLQELTTDADAGLPNIGGENP
jgi:hypothetical protein